MVPSIITSSLVLEYDLKSPCKVIWKSSWGNRLLAIDNYNCFRMQPQIHQEERSVLWGSVVLGIQGDSIGTLNHNDLRGHLNENCPPQAEAFQPLVSSWECCWERLLRGSALPEELHWSWEFIASPHFQFTDSVLCWLLKMSIFLFWTPADMTYPPLGTIPSVS